jgi:protein-tyrosine-phosphatase
MVRKKVLFVCVHNSARSQMAEAFLKKLDGNRFEVESAGLEPAPITDQSPCNQSDAGGRYRHIQKQGSGCI